MLHDVDLGSAPQTKVAIVGETGCGKTTFAKLLTRLMDPTPAGCCCRGVPLDQVRVRVAAQPGRDGAAGRLPVRRHGRRQRPLRAAVGGRRRHPPGLHRAGARPTGSTPCRRAADRRSASAASRCRSGSASSSPSPGPTSPTPTCSSWTRPPARSTRRPRSAGPGARLADRRPHHAHHRAPAVDRRGRRRGARRRRGPGGPARRARRAGRRRGRTPTCTRRAAFLGRRTGAGRRRASLTLRRYGVTRRDAR